jgi:lysophospholipase L1-like esterase/nicotinamidase-related amidase
MRCILALCFLVSSLAFAADEPLHLVLQSRKPVGSPVSTKETWLPSKTAIIVCDMWDLHHCRNAVVREGEMAPRMNEVLEKARSQGVLIVHAPSSCMKPYEGTPARERAKSAPPAARQPDKIAEWCKQIPAEELAVYPIDQTDGGEDDDPAEHAKWAKDLEAKGLNPRSPWTREIDVLRIDQDKDAISDSGTEIWNLLEARGIQNVILMGVHVNMCVTGRPFGLRQMAKNGKHVVLMRDLTDSMYNPQRWPYVSHRRGTELFIEHIEKHICPSVTSDQILGGQPFAFNDATAGPKRLRILLIGDSTTEASIPKKLAPDEPQLEDSLRILLAREDGLPPTDVVNLGLSGEYIRRLIDSGRYDKQVATQPQADYIFIRYGINDRARREGFAENFTKDFHELLAKLRKDHPKAMLIPMTVIPFSDEAASTEINNLVRQVAKDENLPLFDIYPRYAAELKNGPNMLNYRRYPLSKVPENLRPLATPYIQPEAPDPKVVVMDNRLDGFFGQLPGWYGDRHPNLAGYNVIASETAKWLAPVMREGMAKGRAE